MRHATLEEVYGILFRRFLALGALYQKYVTQKLIWGGKNWKKKTGYNR